MKHQVQILLIFQLASQELAIGTELHFTQEQCTLDADIESDIIQAFDKDEFAYTSVDSPFELLETTTSPFMSSTILEFDNAVSNLIGSRSRKNISKGIVLLENIVEHADILSSTPPCSYCGAKRFHLEPEGFCCSDRAVKLTSNEAPEALWELYTSNSKLSKEFMTYVRTYNNTFSFTSFGVTYDKNLCKRNCGIYTFRIQGQIYHSLNELLPSEGNRSHLQLYFYDTDEQINCCAATCDRLNPQIITIFVELLAKNPYSKFFRSLRDIPELVDRSIVIKNHPHLDQRVNNAPSASQVDAIWVEDND